MNGTHVNEYVFEIITDTGEYEHTVAVFEIDEKQPPYILQYKAYCAAVEYGIAHCKNYVMIVRLKSRCRKLI